MRKLCRKDFWKRKFEFEECFANINDHLWHCTFCRSCDAINSCLQFLSHINSIILSRMLECFIIYPLACSISQLLKRAQIRTTTKCGVKCMPKWCILHDNPISILLCLSTFVAIANANSHHHHHHHHHFTFLFLGFQHSSHWYRFS